MFQQLLRKYQKIHPISPKHLAENLANLAGEHTCFCLLDGNGSGTSTYKILAGIGHVARLTASYGQAFHALRKFRYMHEDWAFAHFAYDLKNETEQLESHHPDHLGFPDLHVFCPRFLVQLTENELTIGYFEEDEQAAQDLICKINIIPKKSNPDAGTLELHQRTSQANYRKQALNLKKHIARGDIYEVNYCMEFFAKEVKLDPAATWLKLNALSEAPFAAFYRVDESWLMCASPERFLKKTGQQLLSQPIKGTRKRGKDAAEDEFLINELKNDPKERSENVMIVDLVRNDLSHFAERGSVQVPELFEVYSFKTVHQLISSVTCTLRKDADAMEALEQAFPMGSMTGAPKLRAMQLIEEHEDMRRGLYSGALGYFNPNGDFDFNVVIRSIQYNAKTKYVSAMVGSALTQSADVDQEYEECLLKAQSLFAALGSTIISA